MTKKPTEINPERSEKYRYLERFSFMPKLIILAAIAVIAATLSWARSERAIDDAKEALAKVELQSEQIDQLTDKIDVYVNKVTRYQSTLYARGIEEIDDE